MEERAHTLAAADGARPLDLDLLPLADAVGLLRSLIGPRAVHDPGAAAELALVMGGAAGLTGYR